MHSKHTHTYTHTHTHTHIYIYIYICKEREREANLGIDNMFARLITHLQQNNSHSEIRLLIYETKYANELYTTYSK